MSIIKIKNFGPIKAGYQENDGWIDIKKVTVFIGNQGSGKSTVAKLISTFTWIEKVLVRGDYNTKWFEETNKLKNLLKNHRIESFFNDKTEIEYLGDAYQIEYKTDKLKISEISKTEYVLPQIIYQPAERNLLSYVKTYKSLELTSPALINYATAFDAALIEMGHNNEILNLPINDLSMEYDWVNKSINLKGLDYKINLNEASSGVQSIVPLYLVTRHLASLVRNQLVFDEPKTSIEELERFKNSATEILNSYTLTDEQKKVAISILASRFNKKSFINIVEEPEQNLFPSSQKEMLWCLLFFNNFGYVDLPQNKKNKLIFTTHSPYIVNYLSLAIQGYYLLGKIKSNEILLNKLKAIIPLESVISAEDVAIYELDEKTGSIKKLPNFEGIPSDNNFLNNSLAEGNKLFDSLLEIEEEL